MVVIINMYKIGIGMLFFWNQKLVLAIFSISKAGIGKVEMFKIGFAYLHTQSHGKQKYILMFESIGLSPLSLTQSQKKSIYF